MTGVPSDDVQAWETVYRRAYPKLFAYSRRRLVDDHEADDVVAEVMARAIAGGHRNRPGDAGIDGWLFGICHNVLRERWRGRRRDARWADLGSSLVSPVDDGPLDHVLRHEERDRLIAAFARLEPDERDLLELRVTGGLDAEAVGEAIGKRPGAVRMAQTRALSRLRTFLEEVT
ncbi:RNA polymerase sigma factor [Aquihabitans daechungensis]|uniref:RNA polymerase sigma factor n=1 Tax=Aquihabitans daechungensis TaxID=1052257 RepID=UPI003BA1BF80